MALLQYPKNPTDVVVYARDLAHISDLTQMYQQKARIGFPLRDLFKRVPKRNDCIEVTKGSMVFDRHPDGALIVPADLTSYEVPEFSISVCLDDRDYLTSMFRGFEGRKRCALIKYENHPHCVIGETLTTFVPPDIAERLAEWDLPYSDSYLRQLYTRTA